MNILRIIEDPAFMQQADTAIRAICTDVAEITYIEHGADNVVAIVNHRYVFRFPRSDSAAKRLYFETALLQKLGSQIDAVVIPELIQVSTRPFFSVSNYIPGEHLSAEQIQALPETEQAVIGQRLAAFIAQFTQRVSGLEVRRLRTAAGVDGLDEPWEVYFGRLFVSQPLPNAQLGPIVAQHYTLWQQQISSERRAYAIHDDLHLSNLLFVGSHLNGIVDFGDANIGGIEEEMRWLYAMGDGVLKAAIEHYRELTGVLIDYDHVREWAIMHELSSYTARLGSQDTQSYPFLRAEAHLRTWLRGFPL